MMLMINLANFSDEELAGLLQEIGAELAMRIKTRVIAGKYPALNEEERQLVYERNFVQAIRAYRIRTGVGLRESKAVVDDFRDYIIKTLD